MAGKKKFGVSIKTVMALHSLLNRRYSGCLIRKSRSQDRFLSERLAHFKYRSEQIFNFIDEP